MAGEIKSGGFPRWFHTVVIGRRPKWTLVRLTVLILTTYIAFKFVLVPIKVEGISMEPTYEDGSINLINRLSYIHHRPQRGDVVGVIWYQERSKRNVLLMKRIVALPGETMSFSNGKLHINDREIVEPYVKFPCNWNMEPIHLEANWYYVVGDNRSMYFEDHTQLKADLNQILGKVVLRGKS